MEKELPSMQSFDVDERIFTQIQKSIPGGYEFTIPTTISGDHVFRGIDGDSLIMFNQKTGAVRKVSPPFSRSAHHMVIQRIGSFERMKVFVQSVRPVLDGGIWNWSVQISR